MYECRKICAFGGKMKGIHLFCYGTLMVSEIWNSLVEGKYNSVPGTIDGFQRYCIRDESYPGLVREPGSQVQGVLYLDLEKSEFSALDSFEGSEYERKMISVFTERSTESAFVYLYRTEFSYCLEKRVWFEKEHTNISIADLL